MKNFVLKEIVSSNMQNELETVGFDKSYSLIAQKKFFYKNLKIYGLTPAQANILKQTAISVGAECAVHREVITGKIELSDCILGGSISQFEKISKKLEHQPFGLKFLGEKILSFLNIKKSEKTKIVGILNLTQNSFSDGGEFWDFNKAIKHLHSLIDDGADIIDIGAESTKPGAAPVDSEKQLEKLLPVLEYIKNKGLKIPVSIDTRNAITAEKCIKAGASIINDVSGFDYDDKMADVISKYGVKIILQHSQGSPENMQNNPHYENVVDEIYLKLLEKIEFALSKGIPPENIIVDPGIGFGKSKEHNFEIIKRIEEFYGLGCSVMLGVSRKSLLCMPEADNYTKDVYTLALNALAIEHKVDYIRVHNVKMHKTLLELL